MSYSIQRLTTHPAILITLNQDFTLPDDAIAYAVDFDSLANKESQPITAIIDMRQYHLSVNSLLEGTKLATNDGLNIAKHPRTKRLMMVTSSQLVSMSAGGLAKLGIVKEINVFDSLDKALAAISPL